MLWYALRLNMTEEALYKPQKGLVRKSLKRGKGIQRTSTLKRPTVKNKPRKPRSLSKLKKELDRVFSIYIRAKYEKRCYTCGKEGTLQNGHFIVRKYLATRWEEDNCRPQCVGCNIYGKGMSIDFEEHLIKDLGSVRLQQMKDSRKEIWVLKEDWYIEKISHYKRLVDNLAQNLTPVL